LIVIAGLDPAIQVAAPTSARFPGSPGLTWSSPAMTSDWAGGSASRRDAAAVSKKSRSPEAPAVLQGGAVIRPEDGLPPRTGGWKTTRAQPKPGALGSVADAPSSALFRQRRRLAAGARNIFPFPGVISRDRAETMREPCREVESSASYWPWS